MMRVDAVFLNPNARGGSAQVLWERVLSSDLARSLRLKEARVFDGAGTRGSVELSSAARVWAEKCVQEGCQNFIAVGGDGTVHLAVNALQGLPIQLGAIGLGSSNDFQKPTTGRGRGQIAGFPCRLDFESAFRHDLGEVEVSHDGSVRKVLFAVNASLGLTAEANYFFNSAGPIFNMIKRLSTNAAVVLAALFEFLKFKSFSIRIKMEQGPFEDLELANLGIIKNPHFAGDLRYDTSPAPDDGLFGIHLCGKMSRFRMIQTFIALARGRFSGLPQTESKQSNELSISSEASFALETDGEVTLVREAHFRVLPQEMVLCP